MEKDLDSMLERVLGPNKAVVRVNAKINFDRRETSSETFSPAGTNTGVLTNEQKLQETYAGGSGTTGGAVGVGNVLRQGAVASAPGGKGGYERVETTNKYEVSKTSEHVVKAPGEIEQLSVAVMVDGSVDGAKIATIRNAVSAACGIDPARKDQIIVESIQFDTSTMKNEEKEMASMAAKSGYMSIAKTAGAIILLLGFLFFLKKTLTQVNISVAPQPTIVQELAGGSQRVAAQAYESAAAGDGGRARPSSGDVPPEEVAQVLKKWMAES
jgi:flagellar M-ring protein FliF